MKFDLSFLRKSIAELSAAVSDKVADIERLKGERNSLASAPGTKDDVIAMIFDDIDADAEQYVDYLQGSIAETLRYGVDRAIGPGGAALPASLLGAREHQTQGPTHRDVVRSMHFVFNAELKAAAKSAINKMKWPANAEPIKGRDKRLAELDKKIAAAEEDLKKLREEAAQAGILV